MSRLVTYSLLVEFNDEAKDEEINKFQCLLEDLVGSNNYYLHDCTWEADSDEEVEESDCIHKWKMTGVAADATVFYKCTLCGIEGEM